MSEAVERKLVQLLDHPTTSPYGNPIPGLDKLDAGDAAPQPGPELVQVDEVARQGGGRVEIRSIAEHVQWDIGLMSRLKAIGLIPGGTFQVSPLGDRAGTIEVRGTGDPARLQTSVAQAVLAHTS